MSSTSPRELVFELDGGARVAAPWHPAATPRATLLILPALGTPAGYYAPLAAAFAAAGCHAISLDHRGNGASSVQIRRGVDFGYRQLVADTARVAEALRERFDAPLFLFGHSIGGHLGALLAGTRPQSIDGLVLCACGTPWYRLYSAPTAAGLYGLTLLADLSSRVLGYYPGRRIGFSGTEAAQLMQEWARLARSGRFAIEGLDGEAACAAVRADVLSISLAHDGMTPSRSVDHLAGKFRSTRPVRVHLDEQHAPRHALDHFRWAREPQAVAGAVLEWLEPRLPRA